MKPKPRATRSTLEKEQQKYLRNLRATDPVKYSRIMDRALGLTDGSESELKNYLTTRNLLKKAGIENGADEKDRSGARGLLLDIADSQLGASLGLVAGQYAVQSGLIPKMLAQVGGEPAPPDAAALRRASEMTYPTIEPAPVAPPAVTPEAPRARRPGRPPKQQYPDSPIPPIPEGEIYLSFASRFIVSSLGEKTPAEAAAWLLAQPHPQIQEIIQQLPRVPTEQLGRFLDLVTEQAPDLEGVAEWLKSAPRWPWTVELFEILRESAQATPPVAPPSASTPQ